MRGIRTILALSSLIFAFGGCGGCQRGTGDPLRWISQDAEAVFEIRDINLLVRTREKLLASFSAVVSNQQIVSLQDDLRLRLGFDPSTREGLAAAGLPAQGSIAAQLDLKSSSVTIVLPVAQADKASVMVETVIKARIAVDTVKKENVAGAELSLFQSAFGADTVTVAAYTIKDGLLLLVLGSNAKEQLSKTLALAPEASVKNSPEYLQQLKALGSSWELRLISPSGAQAVQGALRTAGRSLPIARLAEHPDLALLKSAGWSLDFSGSSAKLTGRVRLDEKGLAKMKAAFEQKQKIGAGVLAIDVPNTVLTVQAGGNASAVLEAIAPKGTPEGERLAAFFARIKSELATDMEAEVLPLLTGHGAAAVGVGDLSQSSLEALMRNPYSALWMSFAVGVSEPDAALAIERRLDPQLSSRGLTISERDSGGAKVRRVAQTLPNGASLVLVESFGRPGAVIFANEPAISDAVLSNKETPDKLAGHAGVYAELRFTSLMAALQKLDLTSMPLIARSLVAKGMEALTLLERLQIAAQPVEDGLSLDATLTAHVPAAGQK